MSEYIQYIFQDYITQIFRQPTFVVHQRVARWKIKCVKQLKYLESRIFHIPCHFPGDYFPERGGLRQSAAESTGRDERMRVDTRDTEFRPSKNQTEIRST